MDAKKQDQGEKVTAEQVKELVRRYAEQEFPGGWANAGVTIRVGPIGGYTTETLALLGPLMILQAEASEPALHG